MFVSSLWHSQKTFAFATFPLVTCNVSRHYVCLDFLKTVFGHSYFHWGIIYVYMD